MDRNAISLIGSVDTLKHVLESDPAAQKSKELRAAAKRLENIRQELLTEGLRYSRMVGAARDSISEVSAQLQGHFTEQRDMLWVLQGLQSANNQHVDPPLPPSSSVSGPGGMDPGFRQVAESLLKMASGASEPGGQRGVVNRFAQFPKPRQTRPKAIR